METVYKVNIIESERGWGQKIDDVIYFSTQEKALDYIKEYNKSNTSEHVPDWYMVAQYDGTVQIPDSSEIH